MTQVRLVSSAALAAAALWEPEGAGVQVTAVGAEAGNAWSPPGGHREGLASGQRESEELLTLLTRPDDDALAWRERVMSAQLPQHPRPMPLLMPPLTTIHLS